MRTLLLVLLVGMLALPSQAGILKIPVQDEIDVGREAAARFEAGQRLMGGPQLVRIQRIGAKIARATGRADLPFTFKLVDNDAVNAICFPGGYIYVFRGLMDLQPNDDELACVLGHEATHAVKSHAFKAIFASSVLRRLSGPAKTTAAVQVVDVLTSRGVGRRLELEADHLGVGFAFQAGYDPQGLINVLEVFQQMEGTRPSLMARLAASHPPAAVRIKKVQPEVNRLKNG